MRSMPVGFCIFTLGFSAVVAQLIMMREMLAAFTGNEVVFGILLGNWLLATGAGALLARTTGLVRRPGRALVALMILIAVLPVGQVFAVRTLRDIVFVRGVIVGASEIALAGFILLLPYCAISGYLLVFASAIMSQERGTRAIGAVYLADSIGSIVGGAAFTFVLVQYFDHFTILFMVAALNLIAVCWVLRTTGQMHAWAAMMMVTVLVLALGPELRLDERTTAFQFPGQQVLFRGSSPYGRVVVTENAGQRVFYQNGVPITATENAAQAEETVHFAMAQRPQSKRVLLVSGGISGTTREIAKYGVTELVYVELDPLILDAARRFEMARNIVDPEKSWSVKPLRIVEGDARAFVRHTKDKFDVVILDLPPPSTTQLNRFFTVQFFRELHRVLAPGGVVSVPMGEYSGSVSAEQAKLLSSECRTLENVFRNVQPIPSERILLLASDNSLTTAVAARLTEAGIQTRFINAHYLDAMLTPDHLAQLTRATREPAGINRDFRPMLYLYQLQRWVSQFQVRFATLELLLLVLFVLVLPTIRPPGFAVFASGFAAASLEFVLLLGVQVLCGSAYIQVGVIVTAFMAGLAVGSYFANRKQISVSRHDLAFLSGGLAVVCLLVFAFLNALEPLTRIPFGTILTEAAIAFIAFALAGFVGAVFPVAARVTAGDAARSASRLYVADFVGSAIGALLASTLLIPLTGIAGACILACALNAGAAVLLAVFRR